MHKNSRVISAVVRAANTQLYLRGKLRLHAHNLYRANDELGDRKAEYYWKYGRTEVDWTAHQGSRDAEEGRGGELCLMLFCAQLWWSQCRATTVEISLWPHDWRFCKKVGKQRASKVFTDRKRNATTSLSRGRSTGIYGNRPRLEVQWRKRRNK